MPGTDDYRCVSPAQRRAQVVVAASLPPGITTAQFSSLVALAVERRLRELLPGDDCAVVAVSC